MNDFRTDRPTLVFIHGLSGSSSAWLPYEELFESQYNLLTIDLRGHGMSDKPRRYDAYALKNFVDDVYKLLNHASVGKCIFVSHSFGTLIALEFIVAHQELVSRAIFLSPTAYLDNIRGSSLVRAGSIVLAALFRLIPFHPVIRGRVDYSRYHYTGDWDMRRIFSDISRTTLRVYIYCLAHAYAVNYDELWKEIRVPTLIMHGTEDSYIPASHSVQLSKEIQHATLVLLPRANHIIVLNNIPEVSHHIETFVS